MQKVESELRQSHCEDCDRPVWVNDDILMASGYHVLCSACGSYAQLELDTTKRKLFSLEGNLAQARKRIERLKKQLAEERDRRRTVVGVDFGHDQSVSAVVTCEVDKKTGNITVVDEKIVHHVGSPEWAEEMGKNGFKVRGCHWGTSIAYIIFDGKVWINHLGQKVLPPTDLVWGTTVWSIVTEPEQTTGDAEWARRMLDEGKAIEETSKEYDRTLVCQKQGGLFAWYENGKLWSTLRDEVVFYPDGTYRLVDRVKP